jgi:hypothetical protein
MRFYLPAKATRCRLGKHSLSTQRCVMIEEFPHLGGDLAVGWVLPQGGAYHVPLQLLVFSIKLRLRATGEGDGKSLRPSLVPL